MYVCLCFLLPGFEAFLISFARKVSYDRLQSPTGVTSYVWGMDYCLVNRTIDKHYVSCVICRVGSGVVCYVACSVL